MQTIEFFFDFGSPYAYFANTQLPALARKGGADLVYCPVAVLRLMELAGNRPTTLECKNKRRHAPVDFVRWAKHYNVAMKKNPFLAQMKLEPLLQGVLAANEMGVAESYVSEVFKGIYADALDLGDEQVFIQVLDQADIDGKAIAAARNTEPLAAELAKRTEQAVERGLFGVPTFIVGDELYFGNDRLLFVEKAVMAKAG
jgi:2-hydroxychromene-2-carboxylate isomerase